MRVVEGTLQRLLIVFREALESIRDPHFFGPELGYQGELLAEIRHRLPGLELPGDPLIRQEYQKRFGDHGLTVRPDLIIHVPFERHTTARRDEGNFVAVEIKVNATSAEAIEDFESLRLIAEKLRYPLTIFLNVCSSETFAHLCPPSIAAQSVCFAVQPKDGIPVVVMQHALDVQPSAEGI